jgi:hypothetical protein
VSPRTVPRRRGIGETNREQFVVALLTVRHRIGLHTVSIPHVVARARARVLLASAPRQRLVARSFSRTWYATRSVLLRLAAVVGHLPLGSPDHDNSTPGHSSGGRMAVENGSARKLVRPVRLEPTTFGAGDTLGSAAGVKLESEPVSGLGCTLPSRERPSRLIACAGYVRVIGIFKRSGVSGDSCFPVTYVGSILHERPTPAASTTFSHL